MPYRQIVYSRNGAKLHEGIVNSYRPPSVGEIIVFRTNGLLSRAANYTVVKVEPITSTEASHLVELVET